LAKSELPGQRATWARRAQRETQALPGCRELLVSRAFPERRALPVWPARLAQRVLREPPELRVPVDLKAW